METKTAATKSPDATKKLLTYETLSAFNQGFAYILQNLQRLEKLGVLQREYFIGLKEVQVLSRREARPIVQTR